MKLVVLRHAETVENTKGIIMVASQQGLLTKLGRQQAKKAGAKLEGEKFDAIYSSDLQRCIDTAKIINDEIGDIPFYSTPQLREVSMGKFEGLPVTKLPIIWIAIRLAKKFHIQPPGGESWQQMLKRIKLLLNDLYEQNPDGTYLIVTHNFSMQAIWFFLNKKSYDEIKNKEIPYCSIERFTMTKLL